MDTVLQTGPTDSERPASNGGGPLSAAGPLRACASASTTCGEGDGGHICGGSELKFNASHEKPRMRGKMPSALPCTIMANMIPLNQARNNETS